MARVFCACTQKVGTSCSHTKLQVAWIAQRQSSSATQTSPLFLFAFFPFIFFFVVFFYVCLNFGCVVFVFLLFIFFLLADLGQLA